MARTVSILRSLDTIAALTLALVLVAILPEWIRLSVIKDVLGIATASLATVFAVFTASLAVIVSGSDNDFVRFVQEDGTFDDILYGFKSTLFALFVALLVSAWLYVVSAAQIAEGYGLQRKWAAIFVGSTFAFALVSTMTTMLSALRYAKLRGDFIVSSGPPNVGLTTTRPRADLESIPSQQPPPNQ